MPAPDDTAAPPHRSWVPAARQRLAGARIAVGSDLHLLEMALAERAKLVEAVVALLDWMDRVTTEGCHPSVAAAAADKAHAALALARRETP